MKDLPIKYHAQVRAMQAEMMALGADEGMLLHDRLLAMKYITLRALALMNCLALQYAEATGQRVIIHDPGEAVNQF